MLTRKTIGRRGILIAATGGVLAAGVRLIHDLTISDVCPDIGFVPVCGIVLVSHLAVLGYGAWLPRAPRALFYVGGFPALVVPVIGSFGELRSPGLCHSTMHGAVPDCFILASLSLLLVLSFVWANTGERA